METKSFQISNPRPSTNGSVYFRSQELENYFSNKPPREVWDNGTIVWGNGLTQTKNMFFVSALFNRSAEKILQACIEGAVNKVEFSFTWAEAGEEYTTSDGVVEQYKQSGVHLINLTSQEVEEKVDRIRAKQALEALKEKRKVLGVIYQKETPKQEQEEFQTSEQEVENEITKLLGK